MVGTWEDFTLNPNWEVQAGPCQNSRVLGSGDPLSPTTNTPALLGSWGVCFGLKGGGPEHLELGCHSPCGAHLSGPQPTKEAFYSHLSSTQHLAI